MAVSKRRTEAQQKGFCFNCLCTAHTREWCPSRKTCMVCHKNHHTMLHMDANKTRRSSEKSSNSRRSSSPSASSTPSSNKHQQNRNKPKKNKSDQRSSNSPAPQRHRSNVSERLSCRAKCHIFVPTALAKVVTTEGCDKIRLLMNSGAAQTLLSTNLVERIHLPITQRAGKTFATLNLLSFHDHTVKIQITGEVRPQLNTSFAESTNEKRLQSVYNHLTDLADPHFYNPINIEILLANDNIPKILRAGLIQTGSNMPIAQSTVFGWMISGACEY
ncbi:uncharacterized protein isoform X2 [Musca autumnalis]